MKQQKMLSYTEATGVIRFKMTNNYMFRFILQKNKKVLTGLICSLLHLQPKDIKKIEITNPINLAGDVSGKEFILDAYKKAVEEKYRFFSFGDAMFIE